MAFDNTRKFMIQDIVTMGIWHPSRMDVFDSMDDVTLYALWKDLVNLTMKESIKNDELY